MLQDLAAVRQERKEQREKRRLKQEAEVLDVNELFPLIFCGCRGKRSRRRQRVCSRRNLPRWRKEERNT